MERPKIKIPLTTTDKIIETINVIALISFWTILLLNYSKLPHSVPIHYNAAGEVNKFGNKIALFILPIVATAVFVAFTYLSKIPHTFNYVVEINIENAERQYAIATKMLRYLKLSITCVFFLIFHKTMQVTNGKINFQDNHFLIFTLGIIVLPIVYFFMRSVRSK